MTNINETEPVELLRRDAGEGYTVRLGTENGLFYVLVDAPDGSEMVNAEFPSEEEARKVYDIWNPTEHAMLIVSYPTLND